MRVSVVMPKLGLTMEEGSITAWQAQVCDRVERGQPLFEVLTDKISYTVEAQESGWLAEILVEPDHPVPPGTPVAVLVTERAELEAADGTAEPAEREAPAEPEGPKEPDGSAEPERPAAPAGVTGAAAGAVATAPPFEPPGGVKASPLARRTARELGIDLKGVRGTGPGGRILDGDVRAAAQAGLQTVGAGPAPAGDGPVGRLDPDAVRAVTARRMVESKQRIPHFYEVIRVDATHLRRLREQHRGTFAQQGLKLTYTALLVAATARALREFPRLNGHYAERSGFEPKDQVHLGIAMDLGEALVVPVLRGADTLGLEGIARGLDALERKRQAGQFEAGDFEAATFTISNLGMYGIESFTAIIDPPQVAILAVGALHEAVVPVEGMIAVRPQLYLTLSVDHRAADGAYAARFLSRLRQLVEGDLEVS